MQSNYYAAKVYAEHPLRVWPFDENVTYVSALRQGGDDDLTQWDANGNSITKVVNRSYAIPMENKDVFSLNPASMEPIIFSGDTYNMSEELPFSISAYVMCEVAAAVLSYEIGIATWVGDGWVPFEWRSFSGAVAEDWVRIFSDHTPPLNTDFKIYIKYGFVIGVENPVPIIINGIAAGEFSKNYVSYDDGIVTQEVTPELDPFLRSDIRLEPAMDYSFSTDESAYYCVRVDDPVWHKAQPLAKNDGIPMVFGASNSTAIFSLSGAPGIVFDAQGMLHENGRYNKYTLELWMRQGRITTALPTSSGGLPVQQAVRLLGPLENDDGLWRDDTHIYLCIDNKIVSYQVGIWYRPLLVGVSFQPGYATLTINGEQVGSLSFDQDSITLSSVSQWWGIYNNGFDLFEIDCLTIFPFISPTTLIKRRYGLGQAVEELESIESTYNGTSWVIDYPRAKYDKNVIYPTVYPWRSGQVSSLNATFDSISVPQYEKPVFTSRQSKDQWIESNRRLQDKVVPVFRVSPSSTSKTKTLLRWPKINLLNEGISHIQIDFFADTAQDNKELFRLYNNISGARMEFKLVVDSGSIKLQTTYNGQTTTSATAEPGRFVATINIQQLIGTRQYKNFFDPIDAISMTIGSDDEGTYVPFTDRYCTINFFNSDTARIQGLSTSPISLVSVSSSAQPVIGNYSYGMKQWINSFGDFVGGVGMWKDTLPLSMFAKEITQPNGKKYYRIDLLQFNAWLDDSPLGQFVDKAYTTIEFTKNPFAQDRVGEYVGQDIAVNRVVRLPSDYLDKEYVVRNGTVILFDNEPNPEKVFVIIRLKLTSLANGIQDAVLKRIEIAANSANGPTDFISIGTRYGQLIYPTENNDTRYYPPTRTAIRINKETAPYLRLTEDSGIALLPKSVSETELQHETSQLSIKLNLMTGTEELIAGMKFWMQLDEVFNNAISKEKKIADLSLELEGQNKVLELVVVPYYAGTRRPKLYLLELRNEDGTMYSGAQLLQNIYQVETPVLEARRWVQISIVFSGNLKLYGNSYFNMYSGAMFQNISIHQPTLTSMDERIARRAWLQVKYSPETGVYDIVSGSKVGNNVTLNIGAHTLEIGDYITVAIDQNESTNGDFQLTAVNQGAGTVTFVNADAVISGTITGQVADVEVWSYWTLTLNEFGETVDGLWSNVLYINEPSNYYWDAVSMTNTLFGSVAIVADSHVNDLYLNTGSLDAIMDVYWSRKLITPV